jgi:glycosyltransferase involved in cell wall biosynthesis
MKSILVIANSTHGGGAENTMIKLHSEFMAKGLKSTYIALNAMNDGLETSYTNVIQIGRNWSDGPTKTLKSFRIAKKKISRIDYDAVLINCELPELFAAFINFGTSKLIVVEHTTKPWDGRRLLGIFVRMVLKFKGATWVTVNSEKSKIWPFGDLASHIPNPISPVSKCESITNAGSAVYIGRLRKEKCPDLALQACLDSSTEISIIGNGNLFEDLSSRYGNSKLVTFHGYIENPWSRISPTSLVVIPSEYEGDGVVVCEALQNGNPVLLRDIPDLRRFNLNDLNYFKDCGDLTRKLMEFKENATTFNVSKSERDRILTAREIHVVRDRWLSLIDNLVEGAG